MSNYAYPYDPTATAAGNVVRNERHNLNDYKNQWNCIIPNFAPFYRKDFIVKLDGRTLYEGLDYYLGHYYEQASEEVKLPVYGSIMLTDSTLVGTLTFETYRTTGGITNVSLERIGIYLSQEPLPDPRNEDWAEVMQRTISVPGTDLPENVQEAIQMDGPTGALDRLRKKLAELNVAEKDKYNAVFSRIAALSDKIEAHDVEEHEWRKDQHNVTYAQLNALKRDATAVNALKAYGRTIGELATLVNLIGINNQDTDELFRLTGDVLEGRLKLEGNSVIIRNDNGLTSINMNNGNIEIIASSGMSIEADSDRNASGVAAYAKAAQNQLTVHSSGSGQNLKSAVFNGFYLIHVDNISNYLPPPEFDDTILHVASSDTVRLSGLGTNAAPLTGTVYFPTATTTKEGLFILTHSIFSGSTSHAATGEALRELKANLDKYIPNTRRVNNRPLTGSSITLTASDFGLSRVNNTAADAKPPSNAFKAEVGKLSNIGHQHSAGDFTDVPQGSTTVHGVLQLSTSVGDSTTTALTPSALTGPNEALLAAESEIVNKLPSKVMTVTQYGGFSYLPKPVLGAYGAAGPGYANLAGELEANGDFVFLRNGGDSFGRGVYYFIVKFNSDGTYKESSGTTIEYRPPWLPNGRRVIQVEVGYNGCFTAMLDNNDKYIVLTRGTMDASKHVAAKTTEHVPYYERRPIIIGNKIYKVEHTVSNSSFHVKIWSTPLADIENGEGDNWTPVLLSGRDIYDDQHTDQHTFKMAQTGLSTNKDSKPMAWLNDEGYWTGSKNIRHSNCAMDIISEGNKLRITTSLGSYFSNGFTAAVSAYCTGIDVDLSTETVTVISPESYPFEITRTIFDHGELGRSAARWPGGTPNSNNAIVRSKGKMASWRFDGLQCTPQFHLIELVNPTSSQFNDMNPVTRSWVGMGSPELLGAVGSVMKGPFSNVMLRDKNRIVVNCKNGLIVETYNPNGEYGPGLAGWGPTNARSAYSAGWESWRIPYLAETDTCEGATWTLEDVTQRTTQVGETLSNAVTFSSGLQNSLKTDLLSRDQSINGGRLIENRVNIHAFGRVNGTVEAFFVHGQLCYNNDNRDSKFYTETIYRGTVTVSGGNVTGFNVVAKLGERKLAGSATGFGPRSVDISCNYMGLLDNGTKIWTINQSQYCGWVGHGGAHVFTITKTSAGAYSVVIGTQHTHVPYGIGFARDLGLMSFQNDPYSQAIKATVRGKGANALNESGYSAFLTATKVATGTIIYFTARERYYSEYRELWLDPQNFDVATFPSWQNSTFYIYVESYLHESGGNTEYRARYTFDKTKHPDTGTRMRIGYVTTDTTSIKELKVESATRLGSVYEVNRHLANPKAHDSINNLSKESFGLSKVRNMAMIHNVEMPSFEDVYNNWKRFVHNFNTTNQPADAAAMNAWRYSQPHQSLQSLNDTATKHMFVGFISPEKVSDYVFDTSIFSDMDVTDDTFHHGDDDWFGVVLAYAEDADGREHTLTAMRSGGAGAQELYLRVNGSKTKWRTGIVYNFHQSDVKVFHHHHEGTANSVVAHRGLGKTRIRAVRTGDKIHVQFYGYDKEGRYDEIVTEKTIDLTAPELSIFRGQANFGYMSQSQGYSTFVNHVRPDEDVGNFYASADMCRLLSNQVGSGFKMVMGRVKGGQTIPVPAGFTASQCQVILRCRLTNGQATSKKVNYMHMSVDASLRVTYIERAATTASTTNSQTGHELDYLLIARKRV